jgi:hypothetical protein
LNARIGVSVTVVRSALEIASVVFSLLLIAVGGGLTSDPVVLAKTAAAITLPLTLAALLERWGKLGWGKLRRVPA